MDTLPDRFWSKVRVDNETGCLNWIAAVNNRGRPVWSINSKAILAYRAAWEVLRGQIPAGMTLDHLCGNGRCVNVDHMEIVTRSINSRRGTPRATLRTAPTDPAPHVRREVRAAGFCRWGHDITTPDSTRTCARGDLVCLICDREQQQRYDAARRRTA